MNDRFDAEYEAMVQANFATIDRVICRRGSNKNCYNGKPLLESAYNYRDGGESNTLEQARANYLSDGTLADDGSVVCDACYAGF